MEKWWGYGASRKVRVYWVYCKRKRTAEEAKEASKDLGFTACSRSTSMGLTWPHFRIPLDVRKRTLVFAWVCLKMCDYITPIYQSGHFNRENDSYWSVDFGSDHKGCNWNHDKPWYLQGSWFWDKPISLQHGLNVNYMNGLNVNDIIYYLYIATPKKLPKHIQKKTIRQQECICSLLHLGLP